MPVAHPHTPTAESRAAARAAVLRWVERLVTFLALLIIPVFIMEADNHGNHTVAVLTTTLSWIIWLGFAAEVVLHLAFTEHRRSWLLHHPLEVGIVLLTPPFLPDGLRAAQAFRLLRLLRLAVVIKHVRNLTGANGMKWATVLAAFGILGGGAAFTVAEEAQHLSTWDGIWWALTTVTTVTYGDIIPRTDLGRAIALVIMFIGITYVSLLTATLAQYLLARVSGSVHSSEVALEKEFASVEDEVLVLLRSIEGRLSAVEAHLGAARPAAGDDSPG